MSLRGKPSLGGAALSLALVAAAATPASARPPAPPSLPLAQRSTTDGILDTPVEEARAARHGHRHGGLRGHLPRSRENVELVGKLRVKDAARDRIADVASLGDFAYLAAFEEPRCRRGGAYVVDISKPRAPREAGFIPARRGSFVGEGLQALRLNTQSFRGDLLVHNNEICGNGGRGGMSLWDVTRPRRPVPLALNRGDVRAPNGTRQPPTEIHSVFAWQQGKRAFAVQVDDEEREDVDIFEITNPRRPRHIAEVGLPHWPAARSAQAAGIGTDPEPFHHDVQVRNVDGNWRMLLSYWDAGYIVLDVDDPARPIFVEDSEFPDPDPLTGFRPPEGNGHYAEWDRTGKFILAADEDFSPFRLVGRITSGPFSGEAVNAAQGSRVPRVKPRRPLAGPTYFAGKACGLRRLPRAPSARAIAVVERGGCTFTVKARNLRRKGYRAGIVFNTAPGCERRAAMEVRAKIRFLGVVPRSLAYKMLGIRGYVPADCPDRNRSQPPLPAAGSRGSDLEVHMSFDGWGYLRLLEASTLREVDSYAIPEALDPRYASRFGDLTIHETAADPTRDLVYASWYNAGLRVLSFGPAGLREVGHYIDSGGNNFWGVQVHRTAKGEDLVLASDRDSGLYIFRYPAATPAAARARRAYIAP